MKYANARQGLTGEETKPQQEIEGVEQTTS